MEKNRFFELGGLDETHGGWGRLGVEVACKSWLSGGRQVVDKSTWFAHFFRDKIGFPYEMDSRLIECAKRYSRKLWLNDRWPLAKRKLSWLIDHFSPVPDWDQNSQREAASGD